MRKLVMVVAGLVVMLLVGTGSRAATPGPITIPSAENIPEATWEWEAGFRYGRDRELSDNTEYDNISLQPLNLRYGLTDAIELGFSPQFSNNQAAQGNFPDESGLDGIFLHGKIQLHEHAAVRLDAGFRGDDDVFPNGTHDTQFGIQVPIRFRLERGWIHGFGGVRLRSGNAVDQNGQEFAEFQDQLELGIGYTAPVAQNVLLSTELVGATAPVDGDQNFNFDGESELEIVSGAQIRFSPGSVLKPSVGFGLLRGSPAWSVGLSYQARFGESPNLNLEPREQPDPQQLRPEPKPPEQPPVESNDDEGMNQDMDNQSGQPEQPADSDNVTSGGTSSTDPVEPTSPDYVQRGMDAYRTGNYQEAIQNFEQALQRDPDREGLRFNLGSLNYRMGNYEEAARHYGEAVQENPDDPEAHLYLGASLAELGNFSQAQPHFDRVLDLTDNGDEMRRMIRGIMQ